MGPQLIAERVTDQERVRAFLLREPVTTAYMLGDLDPAYAEYCSWWAAREGDHDVAVVLVYNGHAAPVLLTRGLAAGITAILDAFGDDLPERGHVHMLPDHLAALDQHFALERLRPMVRMGLVAADFVDPKFTLPGGYSPIERLGHRDTGDIITLYGFYPDHFFEPHQLSTGHYYGIRAEEPGGRGKLVSAAGVHVIGRADRIAALGNIVTDPAHRGKGLSSLCTAHLVRELIAEGMGILALNVERHNVAAVRVYEKLGFKDHGTFLQGFMRRTLERPRAR